MPGTMIEGIIARHCDREPVPGDIVWMHIDVRTARDFGGANVVRHLARWYPNSPVADPSRTFFTFDCVVPANNIPYANNQMTCRRFARENGIRVFDCDRGIGSHVLIDSGLATPGSTVVGTDSHLNILGAIGALGQGMGDQDIAFTFRTGRTWFEVPPTMRVEVTGDLPPGTTPRDLTLKVVGTLGSRGALGHAVEFHGRAVERLGLDGRITLASMATEMGAIAGLIPPTREVLEYCSDRSGTPVEPVLPDGDAGYAATVEIGIDDLEPLVARPPRPDNVAPVSDLGEVRIDSAFVGSCTNGRYEDIAEVARIIEGRRIADGVFAIVVPSTREVYGRLLEDGLLSVLHEAGFIVTNPGCGGCASGQAGMTGKGQVQVSTSNRNFPGKQGEGDTYLASPATVAASAVLGRIATVEEVV